MELIVMRTNLKEGLSVVDRIEQGGANLPILKNILIETTESGVRLSTTNLEVGVSSVVSGKVIEKGKTTVPLLTFSAIINNLPTERINIEQKGNNVFLKTDNYEATIQGIPAEEFPLIPHIKNQLGAITIKGDMLKEALTQVLAASQPSEARPELAAALFSFSIDTFKIVATDSFRLAEKTIPAAKLKTTSDTPFQILVPLKTAHDVLHVLHDDDEVLICRDEHQVLFQTAQWEFISRLVSATFPDYAAVVPKQFSAEAVLSREELLGALKLASVFGAKGGEVRFKVPEQKKSIEIYSMEQGLGENKYVIPAKITGEAGEAAFNWRYFSDGLRAIKSEEVYFGVNKENKPALLRASGDTSYFYIVMPVLKA